MSFKENSWKQEVEKTNNNTSYTATIEDINVSQNLWVLKSQQVAPVVLVFTALKLLPIFVNLDYNVNNYSQMENDLEPYGKEEHQKCIMISNANTVIDPGAVVVKSLYALVANGAMSGSGRSNDLTFRAEVCWINVL
jgi:hypothetical protein